MRWLVVVALLAGSARADDVNLLRATPTTVAVSSTVANAAILPDHLVDGKLATAWNSQTGELAGAWIAVRVPADARVKTIKLTAGFTHKDKKLGDLFTQNPRIKKVRITQAGKQIVEAALDVENRGLQDIAVDLAGGDFEIRVIDVVPGTKKTWRETCVSELEVWGRVPKVVKAKPAVRLRSLDAPPTLTPEQCVKAVFPAARGGRIGPDRTAEAIVATEALPVSDALVVCRIDHKAKGATDTTVEIAVVKRGAKPALVAKIDESFTTSGQPSDGTGETGSVTLEVIPLTTAERALAVAVTRGTYGPMSYDGTTQSRLYRLGATALEELLAWTSTTDEGEASHGDRCELAPVVPTKTMPVLELRCEETHGHWHDDDPADRGIDTKERTERYVWRTGGYVRK